jgi:hypothetical protein
MFDLVWFQDFFIKKKSQTKVVSTLRMYVIHNKRLEGITRQEDYELEIQNTETHFNFEPQTSFK